MIPWRVQKPTPVLLPGESHGQRSLAGYSPKGRTELDTTEVISMHSTYINTYIYIYVESCPKATGVRPGTKATEAESRTKVTFKGD